MSPFPKLLGFLLVLSVVATGQNVRVVVRTQSGPVRGVIEGDIRAFRGIPFAAPPVGNLRWRPPAPPEKWSGIRDASTFGNFCPQPDDNGNPIGSEDCLFLNVYTSSHLEGDAEQPVMVFLQGGGNIGGSTRGLFNSPAPVTHGVIMVTVEYRLGALGFFVHPVLAVEGDGSSGNYGLMDQIAALAWVQRNIKNFGGDPQRVMIFGVSAGAGDTQVLLASPAARGLFSRAGIESGGIPLNFTRPLKVAEADQAPLVALVGCEGVPDVLACLRAVDAAVLVTNQGAVPTERVVEPRVLPEDPFAVLQRDGSPVPLLTGSNREETTVLGDDPTQALDADQYVAKIHAEFDFFGPQVADQVLSLYPVSDYEAPIWALVAVDSDFNVSCEVRNAALAALGPFRDREADDRRDKVPVWRYLFTHRLENDPSLNLLRAFHREELFFLFGHLDRLGNPYTPSADEIQLSETLMGYWTRFAATGDPNGPGAFHWPRYSKHDEILQLDVTPARFRGYDNRQCDFLTPLINRIP